MGELITAKRNFQQDTRKLVNPIFGDLGNFGKVGYLFGLWIAFHNLKGDC